MRLQTLILGVFLFAGCHCGVVTCQELVPLPDPISTPTIILPVVPVLVEPDIPSEPVPVPQVISTLKPDEWYVIESGIKLTVRQFPEGLIEVDANLLEAGQSIKLRGKFSDGNGKIETRVYRSPFVYLITAVKPGQVAMDLVTVNKSCEAEFLRQVLTVSGVGPIPPPIPPDPDPDVDPDPPTPPAPVTSFRVIFVKESGSTLNAEQTAIPGAKSIRDYLNAKTTPEGGTTGWREYDPQQNTANEQATMKALWAAVQPKIQSVPCMVVEVNGHATVMPLPANTTEAIAILQKHGGQ